MLVDSNLDVSIGNGDTKVFRTDIYHNGAYEQDRYQQRLVNMVDSW
jgi:hypothetical protein